MELYLAKYQNEVKNIDDIIHLSFLAKIDKTTITHVDCLGFGVYELNRLIALLGELPQVTSVNLGETYVDTDEVKYFFNQLQYTKINQLDFSNLDLKFTERDAKKEIVKGLSRSPQITKAFMPKDDILYFAQFVINEERSSSPEQLEIKIKDFLPRFKTEHFNEILELIDAESITHFNAEGIGSYNINKLVGILTQCPNLKHINLGKTYADDQDIVRFFWAIKASKTYYIDFSQLDLSKTSGKALQTLTQELTKYNQIRITGLPQHPIFNSIKHTLQKRIFYPLSKKSPSPNTTLSNKGIPSSIVVGPKAKDKTSKTKPDSTPIGSEENTDYKHQGIKITSPLSPLQSAILLQSVQAGEEKLSPAFCLDILSHSANNGVIRRLIGMVDKHLNANPNEFSEYRAVYEGIYHNRELYAGNMEILVESINKNFPKNTFEKDDFEFCLRLLKDKKQTTTSLNNMNSLLEELKQNMPKEVAVAIEEEKRKLEEKRIRKAEEKRKAKELQKAKQLEAEAKKFFKHLNDFYFEQDKSSMVAKINKASTLLSNYPYDQYINDYKDFILNLLEDKDLSDYLPKVIKNCANHMMTSLKPEEIELNRDLLDFIATNQNTNDVALHSLSRKICAELLHTNNPEEYAALSKILQNTINNPNADWALMQNTYEDLEKVFEAKPDKRNDILDLINQNLTSENTPFMPRYLTGSSDHLSQLSAILGDLTAKYPEYAETTLKIMDKINTIVRPNIANYGYLLSKQEEAYEKIQTARPDLMDQIKDYNENIKVLKEVDLINTTNLNETYLSEKIIPKFAVGDEFAKKVLLKLCEDANPYCDKDAFKDPRTILWNIAVYKNCKYPPNTCSVKASLLKNYLLVEAEKDPTNPEILEKNKCLFSQKSRELLDDSTDIKILKLLSNNDNNLELLEKFVDYEDRPQNLQKSGIFINYPELLLRHLHNLCRDLPYKDNEYKIVETAKVLDNTRPVQYLDIALSTLREFNNTLNNPTFHKLKLKGISQDYLQVNENLLSNFNRIENLNETKFSSSSATILGTILYAVKGRNKENEIIDTIGNAKNASEAFPNLFSYYAQEINDYGAFELCLNQAVKQGFVPTNKSLPQVMNPYKLNIPLKSLLDNIKRGENKLSVIKKFQSFSRDKECLEDFPELIFASIYDYAKNNPAASATQTEAQKYADDIYRAAVVNFDILTSEAEYLNKVSPNEYGKLKTNSKTYISTSDANYTEKETLKGLMLAYDTVSKREGINAENLYQLLSDYRNDQIKIPNLDEIMGSSSRKPEESNQAKMAKIYDEYKLTNKKLDKLCSKRLFNLNKLSQRLR